MDHEDPKEPDEVVDEDDADDLEVDVVDGASRMMRRETLKAEARATQHLFTRRYKNPYCESCTKMRHYTRRAEELSRGHSKHLEI